MPLADRLTRSPRQKQRWLRLARLATSHATSQGSRQQVMSSYFPYLPSTGTAPLATTPTVPVPLIPPILQQVSIHQYLTPQASESTTPHD
jgi:hypothetical protein